MPFRPVCSLSVGIISIFETHILISDFEGMLLMFDRTSALVTSVRVDSIATLKGVLDRAGVR